MFLYLLHINKQHYLEKPDENNNKKYMLSERYQLTENVRSTRMLYPLMVGFLIVSILAIFLLMYLFKVIAMFKYTTEDVDIICTFKKQI